MSFVGLVLRHIANARGGGHGLAFGYASLIALGFHSFLDGLIYESTFHLQDFSGWLSALGLLLHEFPEGAIAFFLARDAGLGTISSAVWAFGVASATTVVGSLAAAAMIERVTLIPYAELLALAAGALLYVVIFHLGPHARFTPHRRGYLFAGFGVAVALAAILLRHA
jgi:zinc transporter ZupT